ncbi:GNAT family N-acetyltransferase [Zooshikella sp. RANM57]|uniref:GNAT family N-acetyltransferase n=1 Tax=Zooshikella sp. RANM57 TaxID=3425863 RepID=UPI003D6FAEF5
MKVVPLDKKKHDRKRFDCEIDALNNYLKVMANQQDKKDNTRTYVLEDEENQSTIIGYYTLTLGSVFLGALPPDLQKKHHNASSGGLIARLAVDKRYKKQGYGELLLIDALSKLLQGSDLVGYPLIIVDAKGGAVDFYKKFNFRQFKDMPNKLFVCISEVRLILEEIINNFE